MGNVFYSEAENVNKVYNTSCQTSEIWDAVWTLGLFKGLNLNIYKTHCKLVVFEKVVCNYAVLKNYITNSVLKVLMFESLSLPLKL